MIKIKKYQTKERTVEENFYYWGVVVKILSVYFRKHSTEIHKRIKKHAKIKTTTTLTTVEFEDLLDKIRNWARVGLEIVIPLPNEDIEVEMPANRHKFLNNTDLALSFKF